MIRTLFTDTSPITRPLMATKATVAQVSPINNGEGFGICGCGECEFKELAFHSVGPVWQNDSKHFIGRKVLNSDDVRFYLELPDGSRVEIVDNTYGEFNNFPYGNDGGKYKAVLINWRNVFNEHGNGDYKVIRETITLGDSIFDESWVFQVRPYSDAQADGTVRIETYQNGRTLSNPFDFTGMNYYQSTRVMGRLYNKTPQMQEDNYQNGDRFITQIRTQIVDNFDLILKHLPNAVVEEIVYDGMLGDRIFVTEYCSTAVKFFNQLPLYPTDLGQPGYDGESIMADYVIKMSDRQLNKIKTL